MWGILLVLLLSTTVVHAVTYTVTNNSQLTSALTTVNPGDIISVSNDVTLTGNYTFSRQWRLRESDHRSKRRRMAKPRFNSAMLTFTGNWYHTRGFLFNGTCTGEGSRFASLAATIMCLNTTDSSRGTAAMPRAHFGGGNDNDIRLEYI